MTPAIKLLEKQKISHRVHEYTHDPGADSYGLEAAEKLGLEPQRVYKTLVLCLDDGALVVAVLPVNKQLSMKRLAKAVGAKKATMAEPKAVERSSGYVLGGVSPLGQKKRLKTIIDADASIHKTIFISAGRRGLELELSPVTLSRLLSAGTAGLSQ